MRPTTVLLLLFLTGLFIGCGGPEGNGALEVKKVEGQLINDIGIASFPTPTGWLPNRSGGLTSVILTREGTDPKTVEDMISIDVGEPLSERVQDSANALAKKFGGTTAKLPYLIDGAEAYRVSIPPNYEQLMPRECIAVHHGEHLCFLLGASKSNTEIWPVVEEIAQSWSWN
ncbi:MAG: hypothetical protein ACI87E_000004 [Mariniblastus sp.]|jgi:hypothetical protein